MPNSIAAEVVLDHGDFYFNREFMGMPDWNYDEPFEYCGGCGATLIDYGRVESYDRYTGHGIITHFVECQRFTQREPSLEMFIASDHDRWRLTAKEGVPF